MIVTFYPPKKDGKIIAFADVMVADGITIRGFKVINGDKGLFAAVPSRGFEVEGETRWANSVVFADSELRERFLSKLLEDFHRWDKSRRELPTVIPYGTKETDADQTDDNPPF
jgi:DNA-binding cell septation regulator SpoVG